MKKMIVVVGLLAALTASSYALNAYAGEGKEGGEYSPQVKALMEEGMDKEAAKNLVAQAVEAAKEEGLEGKELSARVKEAVTAAKEAKAQVQTEGKEVMEGKAAEHPTKDKAKNDAMHAKPLDHPAH